MAVRRRPKVLKIGSLVSKYVTVNTLSISYGEGPDHGPDLVFLHGFPGSWRDHELVYPFLTGGFHVFAPSMRGMDGSGRATSYPMSTWIDDVAAFVSEVCDPPVMGIGHSAGAWFGLAAAGEQPELFDAFVSLDQPLNPEDHLAFHDGRQPTISAMVNAMRGASDVVDLAQRLGNVPAEAGGTWSDHLTEEQIEDEAEDLYRHDPEIMAAWADRSLEDFIMVPELQAWPGDYRGPVLFVDGDPNAGSMVTNRAAEYNMARYPWADRIQLQGLDHRLGLYDDPGRVVAEVLRFLEDLVGVARNID